MPFKDAIDRWRAGEPHKPSRSEAIRWLIGQGLHVELKLEMRHHARSIRSDHATGGRACLEIAGASKRAERGKSPDASRAPGSFHDSSEVETTGVANDRENFGISRA